MRLSASILSSLPCALLFAGAPWVIQPALADTPSPVLSGEIHQEQDAERIDTTAEIQEKTIGYFKTLQQQIASAAEGKPLSPLPALSENSLTYLNSAYLHCTISNGTCPTVLDALLEVDIINSQLSGQPSCPTLKQFWKLWIRDQMEQRQNFLVKTGFLSATNEFKNTRRTQYIRCDEAVAQVVTPQSNTREFFTHRYTSGSAARENTAGMVELLEKIKAEVPDLLDANK